MRKHRNGEAGQWIANSISRSAIEDTALGPMLLVVGDRGICHLQFADSRDELERIRSAALPECDLNITADVARLLRAVVKVVDGQATDVPFKLEIRGTAFQKLVWQHLMRIPAGTTVSYRELAKRMGRPTSVRAVATACGANRIAVLIPCHRVLRSDGGLGGYRWGVERKRRLLERESALTGQSSAEPLDLAR